MLYRDTKLEMLRSDNTKKFDYFSILSRPPSQSPSAWPSLWPHYGQQPPLSAGARYDLQTRIGGLSPPRSEIRSALILLSPASLYLTSEPGRPAYFRNKYLGIVNNKAQIITLSPFAAFIKTGLAKRTCAAPPQIRIRIRYQIVVISN